MTYVVISLNAEDKLESYRSESREKAEEMYRKHVSRGDKYVTLLLCRGDSAYAMYTYFKHYTP